MSATFRLLGILKNVIKNPGNFAAGGLAYLPEPVLYVRGIGDNYDSVPGYDLPTVSKPIYLPIREQQAKDIAEQCVQAPYGRGEKTIVDTSVRKTWQLDPSYFSIDNRA